MTWHWLPEGSNEGWLAGDLRAMSAAIGCLLAGYLSQRNYRALPAALPSDPAAVDLVSVIIPARNEASRIANLLSSLRATSHPRVEVIVVDDDSEDGTAGIAREGGARVVTVQALPAGWTGKSYACALGAEHARGQWLLFTDADTVHTPDSVGSALATARYWDAGLLSFTAEQLCNSFWERLLLPYAYALYFAGAHAVNDDSRRSIANGQFILCRREAYSRCGGHAAVRDSLTEDVSLARAASRTGTRVILARGERVVSVRMYDSLAALWEGMSKNSFRFLLLSPRGGVCTVAAAMSIAACCASMLTSARLYLRVLLLAAPIVSLGGWYRRFGVPLRYLLLWPLAALSFQLLALDSIRRTMFRGRTMWKGRSY